MDANALDDPILERFGDAVLGRGLPAAVEALIAAAGAAGLAAAQAEAWLEQAVALAPEHPAPLIALYRHHFYGHRLREARDVAQRAMDVSQATLGVRLGSVGDEQARFDAALRFYLFSLKGYAYLSLRLGEADAGRQALDELRRLDPHDRVGGGVLAAVLASQGRDEDAVDHEGVPPAAVRGWGP